MGIGPKEDAIEGTYAPVVINAPFNLTVSGSVTNSESNLTSGFYLVQADIDFYIVCGPAAKSCNTDNWLVKADTIFPLYLKNGSSVVTCNSASTGTVKFLKQTQ